MMKKPEQTQVKKQVQQNPISAPVAQREEELKKESP